jgi:hypothetical protein
MSTNKEHPKQISARQLAANQENAQKSTGPINTISTRYNATKHGLLSEGVSELDDPATFRDFCSRLSAQFKPVGEVEIALVRRVALCLVRLGRAAMLEAEFITAEINPPVTKTTYPPPDPAAASIIEMVDRMQPTTVTLDPGLPSRLSASKVETLLTFQRYETAIENKLYRALNQLERLQRMRRGDKIPAPAALDVNVHHDRDDVASFGKMTEKVGKK